MENDFGAPLNTPSADVGANGGATTYQLATTTTSSSNATSQDVISNALRFAASKSIRTSTIILASFNATAAFATALGIIYGCYTYKKRTQRRPSDLASGLFFIHTVEIFPLILALGITVQSITFAIAQSVGLQGLLSRGCTVVAIFELPALFIAPLIHLVFGVETAVRGFRTQFSPRSKWDVSICLGIVGTFLLVALFVATTDRAPDFCFASLFWFLFHFAPGCFAVFLSVTIILIISIGTIIVNLNRSRMVDPTERMAASRMIYYLALGVISSGFILPFFFSITFLDQKTYIYESLNLSMVASVVSNVNGLMVAGLHLFLRSQNNSNIGHNLGEYERQNLKHEPQEWGNNHRGSNHAMHPVAGSNNRTRTRSDSTATLILGVDAEEGKMVASPTESDLLAPHSSRPTITIPPAPTYPEPTQPPSATSPSHMRKLSYSLFPGDPSAAPAVLPATIYSPTTTKPVRETFRPPPIVKPWMGRGRHGRNSSIISTATVQIGIRLSNVEDFQPAKFNDTEEGDKIEMVTRPSPLARVENKPEPQYEALEGVPDAKMKTLPPVPKRGDEGKEGESGYEGSDGERSDQEGLITLSPSVYSPQESPSGLPQRNPSTKSNKTTKLPSPMGVGFNVPANRGNNDRSRLHAPPRPTGSAVTTSQPKTKADWI